MSFRFDFGKMLMPVRRLMFISLLASTTWTSGLFCVSAFAQTSTGTSSSGGAAQPWQGTTSADYNRRLMQLQKAMPTDDTIYRIGPDDLLDISVFDAKDLSCEVRVSAAGEISLPLVGLVPVAGQTPQQLEASLADALRAHYMRDPQVSVFVKEMQSHGVSVFGAVEKPGVYQIRGAKSLVEVLSMAEGLADDAGDTVTIVRGAENQAASPAGSPDAAMDHPAAQAGQTTEVNIEGLLSGDDAQSNVLVFPGDVVKVARAGTVYVVGDVQRPGGFLLHANQDISVLQAISLAEGLTATAARSQARIIRTDPATGKRIEIPLNLGKMLNGKEPDIALEARDIVFVPNSAARTGLYRGGETLLSITTGLAIYRPL